MIEGIVSGFFQAVSLSVFPFLLVGATFGMLIGLIPGLSGHFAMAMVIPFLYAMEPGPGIAFLLGAHSTVAQGGGLTAILFSTPGTGQNAATLLDGPPMRDKGLAGLAAGAALASCFLGAAFGAVALALLIPVLQQVVLFFGPPEIFVLAILALTFVAVLGKEDLTRSMIAGLAGLLLAMVGLDIVTNQERFTLGFLELRDGLALVPVILGLFAVAEMIDLWVRGSFAGGPQAIRLTAKETQKQIFQGIGEAFRHWWLVLRCSAIGATMGLIPGLGSAPAAFVAYGHAKQSSKNKETFGKGNIEGVIGSEAANDAVEGGALASTIAFGIPGSSSMGILLAGFFILGLETGPSLVTYRVDIVFLMLFTIVLGNLIGTVAGVFLVNPLSRATSLRATLLVPVLLVVVFTGAFAVNRSGFDIGVAIVLGVLGYAMKGFGYSRAALLIGFVLGSVVERNLYLASQLEGPYFVLDPIPLTLGMITLVFLGYNVWTIIRDNRTARRTAMVGVPAEETMDRVDQQSARNTIAMELSFIVVVGLTVAAAFYSAIGYNPISRRAPLLMMVPLLILIGVQLIRVQRASRKVVVKNVLSMVARGKNGNFNSVASFIGWMVLLLALISVAGHYVGIAALMFILLRIISREEIFLSLAITVGVTLAIFLLFEYGFGIELNRGVIYRTWSGYFGP